ncbi:MAG TPA: hypothetical protein VNO52_17685 [Methylomirabilota bacterium]|nr:hypothetical protein [Methylomirabilota bacterium]
MRALWIILRGTERGDDKYLVVMRAWQWMRFILLGMWLIGLTGFARAQGSFLNFEGKQTRPVCLAPDGSRLFAVNTPDARLSVFDLSVPDHPVLIAEIPVGLEPVSVNAVSADEAWVVNEVSDSVSIVSVARGEVIDTLYVKDEPADVVFAAGRAFVSASRNNRIVVFDLAQRTAITNIALFGENPRALAVSPDGARVYAAFALSGNRTTLVPAPLAPPQPPPAIPSLPAPPRVSLIVDAADPLWTTGANAVIQFTMPDHDVVEIDTAALTIVRYFPRVGTINLGLAVHPIQGDVFVANWEARNLTRFERNLRGNMATNRVSRIDLASGAVTHLDLNPGFTYTNFPNLAEKTNALAQPMALAFSPDGEEFYVAAFGTDRIARMNTAGEILRRIELNPDSAGSRASPRNKRGPRGLALLPGKALYVLNRLANTITIIDPAQDRVVREIPTGSHDPTPDVIRQGRGFLYDAKLSGNGTAACASCHIDAEMDLLAWDLGDPYGSLQTERGTNSRGVTIITRVLHPMKGPMTTQTLKGLKGHDPLHWRGDRTNFLSFNGAFASLLGGNPLPESDMQAFREFIETLVFQPNPNQNLDRTYPESFPTRTGIGNARRGEEIFRHEIFNEYRTCSTCHSPPDGSSGVIFPGGSARGPQDLKVPHLRNVYQKLNLTRAPGAASVGGFGITHDGAQPDLFTFLSQPLFEEFSTNAPFKRDLDAFVQCFDTGLAPAVGYTRTVHRGTLRSASISNDWQLMEAQAALTNIDLVVIGISQGRRRGFLFDRSAFVYQPDSVHLPVLSRAALEERVLAGDTLTIMGVPVGSGVRMALDRELDGVLDGDAPSPRLRVARQGNAAVVGWATNAPGYVLERIDLGPTQTWRTETAPRGVVGDEFTVTNSLSGGSVFYRLRKL